MRVREAIRRGIIGRRSLVSLLTGGRGALWDIGPDNVYSDDAGTTPSVVDGQVAYVRDRSGNGYDLVQTTSSKRPRLRFSNGVYSLEGDGVDDFMQVVAAGGLALFKNVTEAFIAGGFSVASVAGGQIVLFGLSTGPSTAGRAALVVNNTDLQGGGRRLDADGFQAATASATLAANTPFTACVLLDYANTRATLRKNGAQVAQNSSFQTAGATSNTSSSTGGYLFQSSFVIGCKWYGGMLRKVLPTAAELAQIEAYFAARTA